MEKKHDEQADAENTASASGASGQPANANPFLDLESAYSTELEEVRHDFTLEGKPAYLVFRPMDAQAMEVFQQIGQKVRVDTTKRTINEAFFEEDRPKQYAELLVNTVTDYSLWKKEKRRGAKPGDENSYDLTQLVARDGNGRLKNRAEREFDFNSMRPDFFRRVVQVALEVNHLDPLTYGVTPTR